MLYNIVIAEPTIPTDLLVMILSLKLSLPTNNADKALIYMDECMVRIILFSLYPSNTAQSTLLRDVGGLLK